MHNELGLFASSKSSKISLLMLFSEELSSALPLTSDVVKDVNDVLVALYENAAGKSKIQLSPDTDALIQDCSERKFQKASYYLDLSDETISEILNRMSVGLRKFKSKNISYATMMAARNKDTEEFNSKILLTTFKKNATTSSMRSTDSNETKKIKTRTLLLHVHNDDVNTIPNDVQTLMESLAAYLKLMFNTIGEVAEVKCVTGEKSFTNIILLTAKDETSKQLDDKFSFLHERVRDCVRMLKNVLNKNAYIEQIEEY